MCSTKNEPEIVFVNEAKKVFEMIQVTDFYWCCDGKKSSWVDGNGNVISNSEILPEERARFIDVIWGSPFVRKKVAYLCRRAGYKVALVEENLIKVYKL